MSNECIICLDELETDIAVLSCKHEFHYKCIQSWIVQKKNYINFCPLCDKTNEIMNIYNKKEPYENKLDMTKPLNSKKTLTKNEKKSNCCIQ